jgi:hypothetical protein
LRLLKDDSAAEVIGSVERKVRNGRGYLCERYRLGEKVVPRDLGKATPELEARLAHAVALRKASRTPGVKRARLVQLSRSEGCAGLDNQSGSLVTVMVRIGLFRLCEGNWGSGSAATRWRSCPSNPPPRLTLVGLGAGAGPAARRWLNS